ncbi:MAG TPA: ATP-binding cassette domain-containing protein [Thermoleophilia bacterium]|nr:ATP-binding cassette domain-containing protein [Thermoleophilia bacterium]
MSLPSDNPVLDVRGLVFPADGSVLRQVHLAVGEGETVAVLGPQGAGKSVLRACLAGELDSAGGTVWTNGKPFHLMPPEAKRAFRLRHYGLVYQDTVFLPELTLADNVALPLRFAGVGAARARRKALTWLARFEIAEAADARLTGLPLDMVRRAALARAMVNDPLLVLADEPFAGLPSQSADMLGRVLNSIALSHGTAVLLFTDDPATAARCQRTVDLVAGRIAAGPVPSAAVTPAAPAAPSASVGAPAPVAVSTAGPDRVKAAR